MYGAIFTTLLVILLGWKHLGTLEGLGFSWLRASGALHLLLRTV